MKNTLLLILVLALSSALCAQDAKLKTYDVNYMKNAPTSVQAWSTSKMVRTGKYREDRFVLYNSEAAKRLWLDATTVRTYEENPKLKGRETYFYIVYNEEGWHLYIDCREVEKDAKGSGLEIFFVPGMRDSYYHQIMTNQARGNITPVDWGMPHPGYRSLKGRIKIEHKKVSTGYGTYMFVPWEIVYDRLPLNGDRWRFSFMRWGTRVTWGGQVHDTGNFGLIQFKKPSQSVATAIQKRMLLAAWAKFGSTADQATKNWSDSAKGDPEFYNRILRPQVDRLKTAGEGFGDISRLDENRLKAALAYMKEWMEFSYTVAELRTAYLKDKLFKK